jgi:ABC-type nitrate/sulfonate/bicarbonate transport system ATPase subunit
LARREPLCHYRLAFNGGKTLATIVEFDGVGLRYGTGAEVLRDLDFRLAKGGFYFLTGPSGAGKTTLLKLLYLALRPSRGLIRLFDEDIVTMPRGRLPGFRRRIGVVFQDFRLVPHLSTFDNVALPLRVSGVEDSDLETPVREMLSWVGLADRASARPATLSGGEQQRVAIARALAAENPLFLLDEPFAALDALTRERLQEDVRQVTAETGRTTVFVTHSADEAVFLGSRIVVLTKSPGTVALDLPITLPRGAVDADELRESREFGDLRAEVAHAVKSAAAA